MVGECCISLCLGFSQLRHVLLIPGAPYRHGVLDVYKRWIWTVLVGDITVHYATIEYL